MKANGPKRKIFDAVDMMTADMAKAETRNGLQSLPVDKIKAFHDHPFRLYEGERQDDMVESIREHARMTSSEDKRLGAYFVHLRDLLFDDKMGDLSSGEYDDLRKKEGNGTITEPEKARLAEIREAMKQNRKFPEKVIKYLWDDAFKFNREVVFETTDYQSLEQVIRVFMYAKGLQRFAMFKENVRSAFTDTEQ